MLSDGRYTVVYPDGQYRTLAVKTPKKGNLKGRTILQIKEGHDFHAVAFLTTENIVHFWSRFRIQNPPARLDRIRRAVERIVADPAAAGMAYAMKESRCCRCGKELTVPASIHNGRGPECAKKSWTREDQVKAYEARAAQADTEWIRQKNLFAEREREQERKAFASDPDFRY